MPRVKHLVRLYESQPSRSGQSTGTSESQPSKSRRESIEVTSVIIPPAQAPSMAQVTGNDAARPRPPKFIPHPLLVSSSSLESIDGLPVELASQHSSTAHQDASRVPSSNYSLVFSDDATLLASEPANGYRRTSRNLMASPPDDSKDSSYTPVATGKFQYPPTLSSVVSTHSRGYPIHGKPMDYACSSAHAQEESLLYDYRNSVPATTVFARTAAPLYLPHLDERVSALPAPSFPKFSGMSTDKANQVFMFPPMHRLAMSGKSLEDLEHNSQIPHWWQSRNKIVGSLVSLVVSITGSSALTSYYSLHGLIDVLQIFALILNTITPHSAADSEDQWRKLLFGTIPNILAFNLATSIRTALIMLAVLMVVSAALLYFFRRATAVCCALGRAEGLQYPKNTTQQWLLVLVTFLLTSLYLPLSTMVVHVLVWSDDLWVVPDPYLNATTTPNLVPLGPPTQYRNPADFCWTTTMKRNEINYAPVIVILALISLLGLTIWFPLHLRRTISSVCPKVDLYTELGTRRSKSELDREYQRILERDQNPLQFVYHDYRRGWATYEAEYLFAKLTALMIVAVARQIVLLAAMSGFFFTQCWLAPFVDPISNASEWTSRLNYVLTAAIALAVALQVHGKEALQGPIMYTVYVITYSLGFYFTVIGWSATQRLVKRLARRIDFSIDIFSPRIDIGPSSPHTRRRIWQEAISTLFLTNPLCKIPTTQPMFFAQAPDAHNYPPYLLDFGGTPAERHVENLKILREVGKVDYQRGIMLSCGSDSGWFQFLQNTIQLHHVGPDCYWKSTKDCAPRGCTSFFGNAWYIPFPPTVVIRYDDGHTAVLSDSGDLEEYVKQNSSHEITRRREVRMALRVLDGQTVHWPYQYIRNIGSRRPFACCCRGRRYQAHTTLNYRLGTFRLIRRGMLDWEGINLASGFRVELTYAKRVVVDGSVFGLSDDFELTPNLARFLALNEHLIVAPLAAFEQTLTGYRRHLKEECLAKSSALSYRFLTSVYDAPHEYEQLIQTCLEFESDLRVRDLMLSGADALEITFERMRQVASSPLATWWYIFWDDLWRRNHDTIKGLQLHAQDFNPHYPTSIAYRPLPRAALETFLAQRGIFNKKTKWGDFFHSGFLNKVYMRMNDIVFHGTKEADILYLGQSGFEHDMEEIDLKTQAQSSTLGTGGGTDHDDESIRARPTYRWEGLLEDPVRKHESHFTRFITKLGVWFGVTPHWRAGLPSMGLSLDVVLKNGQYVIPPRSSANMPGS